MFFGANGKKLSKETLCLYAYVLVISINYANYHIK